MTGVRDRTLGGLESVDTSIRDDFPCTHIEAIPALYRAKQNDVQRYITLNSWPYAGGAAQT